jgi:hypothetical protein
MSDSQTVDLYDTASQPDTNAAGGSHSAYTFLEFNTQNESESESAYDPFSYSRGAAWPPPSSPPEPEPDPEPAEPALSPPATSSSKVRNVVSQVDSIEAGIGSLNFEETEDG